ncbi:MAG: hypothetical protein KC496_06755 [Anaerolineae bacterium]|nr:hypothetical protein [Anaerolineae bacterium]
MDPIIPVTVIACGVPILAVYLVWRIAFKRSLRRLIYSFVSILVDRESTVDPDAPIYPEEQPSLRSVVRERGEHANFERALEETRKPAPQQASIPPEERGEWARDTSANGWPRKLDAETEGDSRPFRAVRLRTEYEQYEYQPSAEEDNPAERSDPPQDDNR